MAQKYAFVMMTKEKWWNRFVSDHHQGKQIQSYIQRGVAPPKNASIILFYVTKPAGNIAGYAEFIERVVGDTMEIWKKHGKESVLRTDKEYREFVGDKLQVSFVRFQNLCEARYALSRAAVLASKSTERLSRKGFYIDRETAQKFIALMD
jgi:predicted transcriptional regulator